MLLCGIVCATDGEYELENNASGNIRLDPDTAVSPCGFDCAQGDKWDVTGGSF